MLARGFEFCAGKKGIDMDNQNPPVSPNKPFYKQTWFYIVAPLITIAAIVSSFSDSPPTPAPAANTESSAPVVTEGQLAAQEERNKTPEQKFEDQIMPLVKNIGASDFSYKGLDWLNSDTDKNAKMVTIKIAVGDFWSGDSLVRNTSELSSDIIEQAFKSDLPIADVVIWYQGNVTDKYGKEFEDVVISHAMTKTTAQKINWSSFNRYALCDFLRSESDEDICMIKPYIK